MRSLSVGFSAIFKVLDRFPRAVVIRIITLDLGTQFIAAGDELEESLLDTPNNIDDAVAEVAAEKDTVRKDQL